MNIAKVFIFIKNCLLIKFQFAKTLINCDSKTWWHHLDPKKLLCLELLLSHQVKRLVFWEIHHDEVTLASTLLVPFCKPISEVCHHVRMLRKDLYRMMQHTLHSDTLRSSRYYPTNKLDNLEINILKITVYEYQRSNELKVLTNTISWI